MNWLCFDFEGIFLFCVVVYQMVGWLSSCLCGCLFCDLTCCERVRAFCFTDFWPAGTCLFVCILPQFQRVLVTDLSKLNFWSASHDTRLATLGKILVVLRNVPRKQNRSSYVRWIDRRQQKAVRTDSIQFFKVKSHAGILLRA